MQPQIMQGIEEKLFPKKTVLLRASRDFMNFYRPCSQCLLVWAKQHAPYMLKPATKQPTYQSYRVAEALLSNLFTATLTFCKIVACRTLKNLCEILQKQFHPIVNQLPKCVPIRAQKGCVPTPHARVDTQKILSSIQLTQFSSLVVRSALKLLN